jgi:hypothetical protein
METKWEHKIHRVIYKLCYVSWYQMNHDKQGKQYKKHRPYSRPQEAQRLVDILGMQDRRQAESDAKGYMHLLRIQGKKIDD